MSVEIVEDTSESLLGQIESGRLDMAICRTSVGRSPFLYESEILSPETLAVVSNPEHRLAGKKSIRLKDLADCRWVVYRANMPMRLLLEREFAEAGIRFPMHLLETTSAFATLSLLKSNSSLVALVSTDVARFFTSYNAASVLPLRLTSRSEPYELVTRRGGQLSPSAKMLMSVLLESKSRQ
jgi:DNA-binding transcriptional LysR family regulator